MPSARTSLSLERKLPLLIVVLLVLLAAGLTFAGYQEVRQANELRAVARLQRLASQLAERTAVSVEQRLRVMRSVAGDSAIIQYLTADAPDSATAARVRLALSRLSVSSTDTPVVAEIRSVSEARRVATRRELPPDEEPAAALLATLRDTPAAIGELFARGDSVFFWSGARIDRDGRALGFLLHRRRIASGPQLERTIRDLSGNDSVSIIFATGSVWTNLRGTPVTRPVGVESVEEWPGIVRFVRDDGVAHVAAHARIAGSPLEVIVQMPQATFLDRPSAFLRRSIVVAIVMLLIGTAAAWLASLRITRPLAAVTTAAEGLAAGNYAQRVAVQRGDETGRLADAFNAMAERIEHSHAQLERQMQESRTLAGRLADANRAKADFLATMSHELRTPLNAIGGYVDLLELGVRGPVNADQQHDLERIKYNQRHLLALIGNILDFTRLDARQLAYDIGVVRVDVAVTDVMAAIAPLLDERGVRRECLGCDHPVLAWADRARFEQILLNLLSNATRFTPSGGSIRVRVESDEEVVRTIVADTGIGIPSDKLGVIFEPFVQVSSGLTRTVGGTGLGLTISRQLARGMNGELTVTSEEGQGTTFTLVLPRAGVEAPELAPADDGRRRVSQPRR